MDVSLDESTVRNPFEPGKVVKDTRNTNDKWMDSGDLPASENNERSGNGSEIKGRFFDVPVVATPIGTPQMVRDWILHPKRRGGRGGGEVEEDEQEKELKRK